MNGNKGLALLLAAALAWPGAARAEEAGRIVSVAGSLTEIVYALGQESRLVGADTTSLYPPSARALPQVGYQRSLSAEGILSLAPDLVLATEAAGPPAVIDQIRAAGVPVRIVTHDLSPDGLGQKVRSVAEALDRAEEGERLANRIRAELDAALLRVGAARRPKVLFFMNAGRGAPLAAGRDTAADAMIRLAGGQNALADFEGYKPLNTEALTAAAPDVLLLPEHALTALGGEAGLARVPGLTLTPAWRQRRIVVMDALLLLGFGPRTGTAVATLARRLNPDLEALELGLDR
ncbi:MAG TPA: helical backbone metal receptor [Accumulibacter sp.]|nr:helical backbone metal receptor [Accumulibacter sp.]